MASSRKNKRTSARIGGLSLHAYGDSKAIAARARAGFERRFYERALAIDPTLRGVELEKKVQLLKSLHFTKLAHQRASKRKKRNPKK